MSCYKKFNHINISKQIYDYLDKNDLIYNNEIFYNNMDHIKFLSSFPEISKFFENLKISCTGIGLIKIFYNKVAIHQDNSASKGGTVRINWPVINCEFSDTIFYENFNGIKETKYLDNGIIFHEYQDENCREINRVCLDSPTALDVSIPHRVWCEKFPRISLSFHLRPNPTWLLS
jgi:hypothetical protein